MSMRLFVAIDPGDGVRDFVNTLHDAERRIRWVKPEHVHLTLSFLGQQADGEVSKIISSLRKVTAAELSFTPRGIGVFPSIMKPRVLWLGVGAERTLVTLQEQIAELLEPWIFVDKKPWVPHLTLARVIPKMRRWCLDFMVQHRRLALETVRVRRFALMQSDLRDEGNRYKVLHEFALSTGG